MPQDLRILTLPVVIRRCFFGNDNDNDNDNDSISQDQSDTKYSDDIGGLVQNLQTRQHLLEKLLAEYYLDISFIEKIKNKL